MTEPVEYQINITNGVDVTPQLNDELTALNKTIGEDTPAAAEKSGNAIKAAFDGAKEAIHPAHAAVRLFHQGMGLLGDAVLILIGIWELYKGSQDKVIENTTNQMEENQKLISSIKGIEEAGGQLTDSQNGLLTSTERLSKAQGATLITALSKKREAMKDDVAQTEENIANLERQEAFAEKNKGTVDGYTQIIVSLTAKLREQSKAYAEVQDNIKAVEAGYTGSAAKIAADTAAAKANEDAQKAAASEAKKAALDHLKAITDTIQGEIKANDDAAKAQVKTDDELLKNKKLNAEQTKALYQDQATIQINALKKDSDLQMNILTSQHDLGLITDQQYDAKKLALLQDTNAKAAALQQEADAKKVAVDTATMNSLIANEQKIVDAGTKAFETKLQQTHDTAAAVSAGAAAAIQALAQQASAQIMIDGAQAASDNYKAASKEVGGGWAGVAAGAAAAAATLAFYGGLAAMVDAAGGAVASAISPPSASTGGGGGGGTGAASSSATTPSAGATPATVAQNQTGVANQSLMSQPVTITVNLDSQPILKAVQTASFNGNIQISANSVT